MELERSIILIQMPVSNPFLSGFKALGDLIEDFAVFPYSCAESHREGVGNDCMANGNPRHVRHPGAECSEIVQIEVVTSVNSKSESSGQLAGFCEGSQD